MVKNAATRRILCDSTIICTFPYPKIFNDETLTSFFSALVGKEFSLSEVLTIGERVQTMERLYNVREGLTRNDDQLPPRLTDEPKRDGPGKGSVVPLEDLQDEYYRAMGWNVTTGVPGVERCQELGIEL